MPDTIKDSVVRLDQDSDLTDLSVYNAPKQTTTVTTDVNSTCRRQLSLFKDDICVQRCAALTAATGLAQWEPSKYRFHRWGGAFGSGQPKSEPRSASVRASEGKVFTNVIEELRLNGHGDRLEGITDFLSRKEKKIPGVCGGLRRSADIELGRVCRRQTSKLL